MNNLPFKLKGIWLILMPVLIMGCSALPLPADISEFATSDPVIETEAEPTVSLSQVDLPQEILDEQALIVNLYAQANPSVVNITIFGQQGNQVSPMGQGSGFLYDSDGHFVTNAHVVDGAEQVEVTFSDGTIIPARSLPLCSGFP